MGDKQILSIVIDGNDNRMLPEAVMFNDFIDACNTAIDGSSDGNPSFVAVKLIDGDICFINLNNVSTLKFSFFDMDDIEPTDEPGDNLEV